MDTTKPRDPEPNETLDAYLQAHGVEHFSAREILTLRRAGVTVDAPPRSWWPRIIPTLELAEMLRAEVGHPLIVGNGYRPNPWNRKVGGARRSPHLFFRALDLDLPSGLQSPFWVLFARFDPPRRRACLEFAPRGRWTQQLGALPD